MKDTIKIIDRLNEVSLSRIYQHTKDDKQFAIIGSQDQDTKKDRSNELVDEIRDLSKKYDNIGYNLLKGEYTYEDNTTGAEYSYVIYNIPKEEALKIARDLNQESIIWKDSNYFGFLKQDGTPDGEFNNEEKNMAFGKEDTQAFSSRLPGKNNSSQKFVFK